MLDDVAWMRPWVSISRTEEGFCRYFIFQQGREKDLETTDTERQLLFPKSPDKGREDTTQESVRISQEVKQAREQCVGVSVVRNSG